MSTETILEGWGGLGRWIQNHPIASAAIFVAGCCNYQIHIWWPQ